MPAGRGEMLSWTSLLEAIAGDGHHVTVFERTSAQTVAEQKGLDLVPYREVEAMAGELGRVLQPADVVIFCSTNRDLQRWHAMTEEHGDVLRVLHLAEPASTLTDQSLVASLRDFAFDVAFSSCAGQAVEKVRRELRVNHVTALPLAITPSMAAPLEQEPEAKHRSDLALFSEAGSELNARIQDLFLEPLRARKGSQGLLVGDGFASRDWPSGVRAIAAQTLRERRAIYQSSRLALVLVTEEQRRLGHVLPWAILEAAGSGAAIVTPYWTGLEDFFEIGEEILVCNDTSDVIEALGREDDFLERIARNARARALQEHTVTQRLETFLHEIDVRSWNQPVLAPVERKPLPETLEDFAPDQPWGLFQRG